MMQSFVLAETANRPSGRRFYLRFTPAEWRVLIEDAAFLRDADNSYLPRRLMGVPVQIIPDHGLPLTR